MSEFSHRITDPDEGSRHRALEHEGEKIGRISRENGARGLGPCVRSV